MPVELLNVVTENSAVFAERTFVVIGLSTRMKVAYIATSFVKATTEVHSFCLECFH